ncbi:MAG: hypothetical protein Q8O03_00340 [Nanoarchaeota archaeon]|nr:hypothetical protein [Nanoarchaeota archaeon]
MKLPESFIPEKQLEYKVEDLLNKEEHDEEGLAIAVEDSTHTDRGRIYIWEPKMDKPKLVKIRKDMVIDFCYFDNKLYDCGVYTKILNTLTDEELLIKVLSVFSMCYYNNKVAYSNLGEIYLDDSKIMERLGWTFALRAHNDKLYDAGSENKICTTIENDVIAKRTDTIRALCSHKGELYDAGHYGEVFNTNTGERIAERAHIIYALCSFKDMLLEGGTSGMVTESFTDKVLFDFGNNTVTAIETIPLALVKELIRFENP